MSWARMPDTKIALYIYNSNFSFENTGPVFKISQKCSDKNQIELIIPMSGRRDKEMIYITLTSGRFFFFPWG